MFGKPRGFLLLLVLFTLAANFSCQAKLSKEIPVPPQTPRLEKEPVPQNPTAKIQAGKATLENGFFKCDIDLNKLVITQLLNKFTETEMIYNNSRLFVINANSSDVPESDYQLLKAKASSDENQAVINASWESKKASLKIEMSLAVKKDSQEMLVTLEAKNLGTKLLTLGITEPFLENIRIGDKVEDDYYFYPMMTGWCGKLPARVRHAYGYMAWMQLLAVFDPVIGGGVFTYSRDAEGMVKNLIVNKRHYPNEDPVPHDTGGFAEDDPGDIFNKLPGTAMAIRHMRYELKAGESANPPDAVIGVSHGDWHDGFNHYKKWVKSWFKKSYEIPQWFRDNYDYISQHPHGGALPSSGYMDEKEENFIYADHMGPNEVDGMTEWYAWWDHPREIAETVAPDYDVTRFNEGDYDYHQGLGDLPAFREEIRRIHEKGGRIQLYMLSVGCSDTSRVGKAHGAEWGRKNSNGNYTKDWVEPSRPGYNACLYVDGWQQHIVNRMTTILKETGADGYRLDVAAIIYPCYNSAHEHYDGTIRSTVSPKKMAKLLERSSTEARKVNQDSAIMAEHAGNEYMTQYLDGYLTQQFNWASSYMGRFRGMSAYNLVFMRFLLPEVKVLIFGFNSEDGGKRAFFNAVGQDRGAARGDQILYMTRTHRVLIENGDAVGTLHPKPLIPTLADGLMANAFPGENKRIWTLCNRNETVIDGELLAVEPKKGVHYVEMLHDRPVATMTKYGKTIISGRIEPQEVICIAELPKILKAQLIDKKLKVKIDKQMPDMRVEFFVGDDDHDKASQLDMCNGKGETKISGDGKVVVKLIKDKYLLDEVIILSLDK